MTWAIAWKFVKPILTFGITLPLWVFMAAGLWLWLDRGSAVRVAVNDAVKELVAGAELNAAIAKATEEQRRRQAAVRALNAYRAEYAADMAAAERDRDQLEREISDYEKKLADGGRACLLDDADVEWLRKPSKAAR